MAAPAHDAASKINSAASQNPNPSAVLDSDKEKSAGDGGGGTGTAGGKSGAADNAATANSADNAATTTFAAGAIVTEGASGSIGSGENSPEFTSEISQKSSAGNADSSIPNQSTTTDKNQISRNSSVEKFSASALDVTTMKPGASNISTDTQKQTIQGMSNTTASAVCLENIVEIK
jgi:hypothetical protein